LTHGHFDHAFHLNHLYEEAERTGHASPRVVAHRNILKRFEKYRILAGYHEHINRVQFNVPEGSRAFPLPERDPDIVFDTSHTEKVGGMHFHAYHEIGETDDHLWVWVPEKQTVFAGDMVIWSFPNVGNPFKVQRYTLEWAKGLEAIAARHPEVLIPGHGPVVKGHDTIQRLLLKIAAVMKYLHEEVIKRLNKGMRYEDILHDVTVPKQMLDSEFLSPRYGCPRFTVHGVLRQYTGWYDGNPSNLFAPKRLEIDAEITALAGKATIMSHAKKLRDAGRAGMALQFVDIALAGTLEKDEEGEMHRLKAELLEVLGHNTKSFIAKSIYYGGRDREMRLAGG
jgi:alkyl sulfatase BDS1-like metallo-beta-lactamase superfamily hydrolase